ncbi:hypothetical protein [Streptomyces sp. XD-27]|uniref:hypothetical protein n=1 Tax=Streptomyces sp. XD-27 TaxID=3062779 RepID=UPI0026F45A01|nr:hypothetical protein [Streptomyces sp. XD-27]WKX70911.1 hypothetical protein Q3Y56_14245 [Streptomyces sp. XD-27]
MRRHPFEPGKLVVGLVLLGVAVVYGVDAAGEWDVPPFAPLVAIPAGLALAALVSILAYALRRARARRSR